MAKKKTSTQIRSEAMKESWARRRNSPMREQARKRVAQPKPQGEPKFWILWMPTSNKPPRVRFGTLEKVQEVADIMVNKYHQPIYVMESVELHKFGKPEVVKYDGAPAKEPKAEPYPPDTFQVSAEYIPPPLSMQGQSWDDTQDNKLYQLWQRGYRHIPELAKRMGRSELAIQYRLEALHLRRMEG